MEPSESGEFEPAGSLTVIVAAQPGTLDAGCHGCGVILQPGTREPLNIEPHLRSTGVWFSRFSVAMR